MMRLILVLFAVSCLLPLSALAQSPEPEQTINIEEAERISIERTEPSILPVSLTQLEEAKSLITIREDFTEMTLREAESL